MDLATLILTKSSKFNGESGEEWKKWFCRFEAQAENIEEGKRLPVLVGLLDGAALDTFVALPPKKRKAYTEVVKALETRFQKQVSSLQAHAELSQVRQMPSESVENFAARVTEMSAIAFPGSADGHEASEGFRCGRFICGLRDSRLQEKLVGKNIQTLTEAVRLCKEFEKNRNAVLAIQGRHEDVGGAVAQTPDNAKSSIASTSDVDALKTTNDRISAMEDQLHEIHESVAAIASTSSTRPGNDPRKPRRLPRCYRCGMAGHFQRDCLWRNRSPPAVRCFACGGEGHIGRDCPISTSIGGRGHVAPSCLCCGREGHWMAECQYLPVRTKAGTDPQYSQHTTMHPEN